MLAAPLPLSPFTIPPVAELGKARRIRGLRLWKSGSKTKSTAYRKRAQRQRSADFSFNQSELLKDSGRSAAFTILIPDILLIHRWIPLSPNRFAWQLLGVAGKRPTGNGRKFYQPLPPRMRRRSFGVEVEEANGRAIEEEV
ncbi:MAG: hypothetical protein ACXW2T_07535 [Allosphingosinicella sp.]